MRSASHDPRVGDILCKWSAVRRTRRTITGRTESAVTYASSSGKTFTTPLRKWIEWAHDAKVENKA